MLSYRRFAVHSAAGTGVRFRAPGAEKEGNLLRNSMFGCLTAAFVVTASQAGAGVAPPPRPPAPSGSETTTLFVGLNWVFGNGGQTVEGIIGVAHGKVDGAGDVTGAKGALHFRVNDGLSLRKVKLTGLWGDQDVQAEGGLGFNVENGNAFATGGVNGGYFHAGGDLNFGGLLEGYVGIHTIGEF